MNTRCPDCNLNGLLRAVVAVALCVWPAAAQSTGSAGDRAEAETSPDVKAAYVLGQDDEIAIWAFKAEEFSEKTFRIDGDGYISLPMIGRIRAGGLTVVALEAALTASLRKFIIDPQVSVTIRSFNSQPVSVIGAVARPGIQQLRGGKTLVEVLTLAGGISPNASPYAKIVRRLEWGRLPLAQAEEDPASSVSRADVNLKTLLSSENPQDNIVLKPGDVITVPVAQVIYVVGEVARQGSVGMTEGNTMTVLQVLSIAGGLTRTSSPSRAKILRPIMGGPRRAEIPVDLKAIFGGKANDFPLMADDILFVPDSKGKKVTSRAIEVAISAGTSALMWGVVQ